jgi:dolichol kinase
LLPGLVILAISYVIPPYPLGSALLFSLTAGLYYMHNRRSNDREYDIWYLEQYGSMMRAEEIGEWMLVDGTTNKYKRKYFPILPGAFFWLLGVTIGSSLFSPSIARTALLVLSVSDPFAAYAGIWFSNNNCNLTWSRLWNLVRGDKNEEGGIFKGPTVVGSLACALATFMCTYVYFSSAASPTLALSSRLILSFSASFVEAVAGRATLIPVDDNLMVPLVVGSLITWLAES